MRVKIELTVVVDPKDWDLTYGTGTDAASVREDVKRWAATALSNHPEDLLEVVRTTS